MTAGYKFVIWTPSYTERTGGVLVLHYLCHYLNLCGYKAFLWHSGKLMRGGNGLLRTGLYAAKYVNRIRRGIKRTSPSLTTPLASHKDLEDAIVVYPETISGNPLRASKVVRWLLHKPGYHNERTNYGENELHFCFTPAFREPAFSNSDISEFNFFVMLEAFKQTNFGQRQGTCFILRKGRHRQIYHNLDNGVIVDNMSHEDMSKIFNKSEFCISYDSYTTYSTYAAICGCKSIVVPEQGVDKQAWYPGGGDALFGIAYGEGDLEWAVSTRPKLLDNIEKRQRSILSKVRKFAEDCEGFFVN